MLFFLRLLITGWSFPAGFYFSPIFWKPCCYLAFKIARKTPMMLNVCPIVKINIHFIIRHRVIHPWKRRQWEIAGFFSCGLTKNVVLSSYLWVVGFIENVEASSRRFYENTRRDAASTLNIKERLREVVPEPRQTTAILIWSLFRKVFAEKVFWSGLTWPAAPWAIQ